MYKKQHLMVVCVLLFSASVQAVTIQGRATGSFCCVLNAQGNPVNSVTNADGTITNINAGSPQFVISNNDADVGGATIVTWGTASNASNGTVNSFTFDGSGSDAGSLPGSTTADSLFQIGSFDYYNAATRQDNISGISFFLDMEVINNNMSMSFPTLQFDLSITNTPDNSNPVASQDFVTIANTWLILADGTQAALNGPMGFELDGFSYEFLLNGFAIIDPATGLPMLDSNGEYVFSNSTSAFENNLTEAAIFGSITQVTAVPLPGAIWLMISGLVLLIGYRRS